MTFIGEIFMVLAIPQALRKSTSMQTTRGIVYANHGGVASSQPLAVSAALNILQLGGSYIDAGIAASAVLTVVEPGSSHLGGDAFLVVHEAKTRKNMAYNGSGESPHGATPEAYKNGIPIHGYKATTVPGLVSTWFEAHKAYGKLPIATLLETAIDYAENGFPATSGFANRVKLFMGQNPTSSLFQTMGISTTVNAGDIVIQSDLANSLRLIAEQGRDAFYKGEIAEKIIVATDGWFNTSDLAAHRTRVSPPISAKYRDLVIHGQPPPSQGMILIEELLLVQGDDLGQMSEIDRTHVMVEAKKLAFEDRNRVLADPEVKEIDLAPIFATSHIDERRAEIDMKKANNGNSKSGEEGNDTTYFLVADGEGNAVSWIQSLFHGFGSAFAVPGTGIILNNRLTGFSLDPVSPNIVAPGKRPAHTLNAWTATNADGTLAYVGGTPGGHIQVQTNLQLVVNLVDLGMNVQEAIEAPRWQHLSQSGQGGADESTFGTLEIENRVDIEVIAELKNRGHIVKELSAWGHGSSVQLLQRLPNGTFAFGSDPRCEGQAAGI
jgi:gamma-glutamyltranspeptidase/glutathione hydrolase